MAGHVRARIGAYGQNTECENAHYYAQPVLLASLGGHAYILDYLDQTSVYTAESQDDGSSTFVQLDDAGIADTFDRMARPFLTLQKAVAEKDMKG